MSPAHRELSAAADPPSGLPRVSYAEALAALDAGGHEVTLAACRAALGEGEAAAIERTEAVAAWIELRERPSLEEVEAVLADEAGAPFVRFYPGAEGGQLSALAGVHDRDRALVGRIRLDPRGGEGTALCITITADNLRLGAATNAVRMASRWFPAADADLRMPS